MDSSRVLVLMLAITASQCDWDRSPTGARISGGIDPSVELDTVEDSQEGRGLIEDVTMTIMNEVRRWMEFLTSMTTDLSQTVSGRQFSLPRNNTDMLNTWTGIWNKIKHIAQQLIKRPKGYIIG